MKALLSRLHSYGPRPAIIWRGQSTSYEGLLQRVRSVQLPEGAHSLALLSDYCPAGIAALLAGLSASRIVAPITPALAPDPSPLLELVEAQAILRVDSQGELQAEAREAALSEPLLRQLEGEGGLVLFTSGSAGKIKAVVHHGPRFVRRFERPGRANRVIPFMLFDHIGGVNTALSVLSAGGCLVVAEDRSPEAICALIERHKVQALPTTPTFLRLMLMSGLHRRYDLSSLAVLAYGAERMPAALLSQLKQELPQVKLQQNYGMSELGILRTRSETSGSPWIRIEGPQLRVRDGQLEVKSEGAMLGYLNEASPFTEDGWLRTGDRVEQRGELFKILGRASELIIVGGEKVYPAEVEDALAALAGVVEVVVSGQAHPITGQLVFARVRLSAPEEKASFRRRMRAALKGKLAAYKIPQKIELTQDSLQSARLKQRRS